MNGVASSSEAGKSQNAGLLAKVKPPRFNNWLLIVVAGLIVLWLSSGAFPLAWTRLMQMIGDWSTLQAASGNAMLAPFAILLLQVVCFLVAWAILVLVIVREVLASRDDSSQAQSSSPESSAAPPTPPSMQDAADAVTPLDTADATADEYIPFDMNAAIFELLPDQDETKPEEEEEELLTSAIVEEDAVFVYGDPLAGDLPEIFSYDTDLMRDVQDQREKVSLLLQADSMENRNEKEEEPEEK
ncbi:hypothetical protein KSF_044200 [Reticulibacter mediterranei]|uniref:Uncharacterized protein n=1 Tax=Reticulibacter mediterranei TaxID=2778369 RepID=A0A8J3N1P0_9CHLR|nr:hypothetical protein [Reticulibacter mediterranei]GHO94372.1 hypothetical protein KSF_044200 [Reticulibacter mediterranei]